MYAPAQCWSCSCPSTAPSATPKHLAQHRVLHHLHNLQSWRTSTPTHPRAAPQAETKLSEAEAGERRAREAYDALAGRMREELVLFQAQRSGDATQALRDFALAQAKLAKQSARHWRDLVGKMRPVVERAQAQGAAAG